MAGSMTIFNTSCSSMAELVDGCTHLVATSPPYKTSDGFSWPLMDHLADEVRRVLAPGALFFLNFGFVREERSRHHLVWNLFHQRLHFAFDLAWAFANETRGRFSPQPYGGEQERPHSTWEPIYVFARDEGWRIDRLAIGVPYTHKSNTTRRRKTNPAGHGRTVRCRGNQWFIPYPNKTGRDQHEHAWPEELSRRILLLAGLAPGSRVLDPCAGDGGFLLEAARLGHQALGYEILPERAERIVKRARALGIDAAVF